MRTTAKVGTGPRHDTEGVLSKPVDLEILVPIKDLDGDSAEGIALGFRQEMFAIRDSKDKVIGSVNTGAGYGTDAIILEWEERSVVISGRSILANWVATFDAEAGEALRGVKPS